MQADELYRKIDQAVKSKNLEALHEIGKSVLDYGSERSWLFGYYALAWNTLEPYGGFNQASEDLGITPKVCSNYANIVKRFRSIKKKGVLFSHYAYLYFYGVPEEDWEELINNAIEEKANVPDFQRFLKDTYDSREKRAT